MSASPPPSLPSRTVTGRVDVHPRGFGFLMVAPAGSEEPLSAFIAPPDLAPFLAGDVASATVRAGSDGRFQATGLSLVERTRTRVFGEVTLRKGALHLKVDREVGNTDWPLDAGATPLQPGDAVVAQVADGKLVLQRKLEPGEDRSLARVVARHLLSEGFPPEALAEAEAVRAPLLTRTRDGGSGRRDLRHLATLTIDAASTRDIDDALAVLPAGPDGAIRVFVSIADASEAVPEGGALDAAARERATSVYLAGHVLPMLPPVLSHDALSLVQGEDRLALTAELRVDPEGRVTAADVYESVIHSRARLTYLEVAAFLERGEATAAVAPVREALVWLRAAASRLSVARARRGGVEISQDEARFTFDEETGELSGFEVVQPTPAHALVERFMVAANEAIACWLEARGVPALYRVHPQPEAEAVKELAEFALHSGFAAAFGKALTPLALAAFDRQIRGATAEPALRSVLRRSLGPSRYTVEPGEHFGLAAPRYLHFTSPIRRYADLMVHRTLKAYLRGRRDWAADDAAVEALGGHVTARARAAKHAERDRHRVLQARFMASRVGERFTGRVTRVRAFGLLVHLDGTPVEALLPTDALPPGGPWKPDPRETRLEGPEGRVYTLGMPLAVKVAAADPEAGRVELALSTWRAAEGG
jgi:ribonuclease R